MKLIGDESDQNFWAEYGKTLRADDESLRRVPMGPVMGPVGILGSTIGRFLQDRAPGLLREISAAPEAMSAIKAAVSQDPAGFVSAIEKYRASLEDEQPATTADTEE